MIPRATCLVLALVCACQATTPVEPAALQESTEQAAFEIIPLEYAYARDLARTLDGLLQAASGAGAGQKMKVMADERTNSLLVMAPPSDMARLKDLIALLDVEVVASD
jgi:type II secretory pathway component GspD/PulD (secretin)